MIAAGVEQQVAGWITMPSIAIGTFTSQGPSLWGHDASRPPRIPERHFLHRGAAPGGVVGQMLFVDGRGGVLA